MIVTGLALAVALAALAALATLRLRHRRLKATLLRVKHERDLARWDLARLRVKTGG